MVRRRVVDVRRAEGGLLRAVLPREMPREFRHAYLFAIKGAGGPDAARGHTLLGVRFHHGPFHGREFLTAFPFARCLPVRQTCNALRSRMSGGRTALF